MRFLAIGKHGEVDPVEARALAQQALGWLEQATADGTIVGAYTMEGGGRALIVDATSREAVVEFLERAPDVKRDWQITGLTDVAVSIERFLAAPEPSASGS